MAVFPRPASPRAAWADFKAFLRGQERIKLLFAALSIMMPVLIVYGFYLDSRTDPPKAKIIYAQSWPENRSDEVIRKQNNADQKILDAQRAARRAEFQRLADKLGIE